LKDYRIIDELQIVRLLMRLFQL